MSSKKNNGRNIGPRAEKGLEEMRDDFIWILTHQLRTLITPIKLFSDMLLTDRLGSLSAKQRSYVEDIHQAASRIVEVVRDILNGYRIQTGEIELVYESTCLEDLIESILEKRNSFEGDASCDIRLLKAERPICDVPVDRVLVRQVVIVLLSNAIKYSRKDRCAITVSVGLDEANDAVLIRVADKGIGIPEEARRHIFVGPFRASNALKMHPDGLGFDLYIAKLIITRLEGDIWFDSEADKGTTFTISLPLHPQTRE